MIQILYMAAGGVLGTLLRYWTTNSMHDLMGRGFPYGTLVVNVLGSFLIGLLSLALAPRFEINPELRLALITGFLGAFTTFSAFSFETIRLLQEGMLLRASVNILLSISLCLLATWAGIITARQFS